MRGDAFLVPFAQAGIELFSSVTVPIDVTAIAKLRRISASRHFAMQMHGKKARVCQCNSYSATHHHSETQFPLRPTSNTAPGLSASALVMSAYLLVFSTTPLILSPAGPGENEGNRPNCTCNLNVHRFLSV